MDPREFFTLSRSATPASYGPAKQTAQLGPEPVPARPRPAPAQPRARRAGPSGATAHLVPDLDSPESRGIPPAPRCLSASEPGTARSPVPRAHKTAPRCFLACVPPPPCPAPPVGAPPPPSLICRRGARPEEAAATRISATPSRSFAAILWPRSSTGASPPLADRAGRHECRRRPSLRPSLSKVKTLSKSPSNSLRFSLLS
jgi:hypothetical protein